MIIFATIFGVGFAILLISLIFGGDGGVDVDTDLDVDDVGTHGPSIFNLKIVALLMVGFGATGFGFRTTTDYTMFQSSMAGIIGAAVLSIIGYFILRIFYASQASSIISESDIIGQTGSLIDTISENGTGQISCVVRGREITFLARSVENQEITKGTIVKITGKTGNIVLVEKS